MNKQYNTLLNNGRNGVIAQLNKKTERKNSIKAIIAIIFFLVAYTIASTDEYKTLSHGQFSSDSSASVGR